MSVTSGWFNSVAGDRRYNAEQMSAIFNGIITDGIFTNEGTAFSITASTENTFTVGIGRAWFNNAWIYNDAILPMTADESEILFDRYDAVVIEMDHSLAVRSGSIKIVKGSPSDDPQVPTMVHTTEVHQYPLAYIYRKADSNVITQDDITYLVGTDICPFAVPVFDINPTFAQWQVEWEHWFERMKSMVSDEDVRARVLELEDRAHTELFRGKNLGSTITDTQLTAIRSGYFTDMWLGDYWVIDDIIWRIVDFDYWYNCGGDGNSYAFTKHHLVIMPDNTLAQGVMYTTGTGTGAKMGYVGSEMYTSELHGVRTEVQSIFGDLLLTHREYLTNAHNDPGPTAGAWYDSTVEIPNEIMMYGSHIANYSHNSGSNSFMIDRHTVNKTQLALFAVRPEFILADRRRQWLRDPVTSNMFAFIDDNGDASYTSMTNSRGIRPVFAIG